MIQANFEGQTMTLEYEGIISDSVRFLKIKFNFDEYWSDLNNTAVFTYNGQSIMVPLTLGNSMYLGDNICYIPQEVIKPLSFTISVFGIKNGVLVTSSQEAVSVEKSGYDGEIPADPTPSAWSQMLGIVNFTQDIAQDVKDRADRGDFNGEGIAAGGQIGQVIVKKSAADYDTEWADRYEKPQGGIPKSDLSSGVQTSLNKADTAIQSHQDISRKQDKFASVIDDEESTISLNALRKVVVGGGKEWDFTGGLFKNGSSVATQLDVNRKQDVFRFIIMPQASSDYGGKTVQYVGPTTADYTQGYFYRCILPEEGDAFWERMNTQPIDSMQVYSLPDSPTESDVGKIVQYVGLTGEEGTHGYFYTCVRNTQTTPVSYEWKQVDVQPHQDISGKQDSLTAGFGISINGNEISVDLEEWQGGSY